jgi:hypothetical protein
MAPMIHSKLGASSCKRWWNCPGSIALIDKMPDENRSSKYSAEGTVAHDLAEQAFKNQWSKKQIREQAGKTVTQDGFKIKIDKEMTEHVIFYVFTIWTELRMQFDSVGGVDNSQYLSIEKKFHLKAIDERAFGTNDASIAIPYEKLTVFDLKYGKGVKVVAEDNFQMLYYALGAYLEDEFSEIELVIIQPRIGDEPEDKISRWSVTPEFMDTFAKDLKAAIKRTEDPKAKTEVGDWCKFCAATAICPSQRQMIQEVALIDFDDLDAELPKKEEMTPQQIANVLTRASLIENWVKSVRAMAQQEAQIGVVLPEYKLVESYGNRSWIDEDKVKKAFKAKGDKIFGEPKLKSPAQLEKVVGKGKIDNYVQRVYKGTILVPESDKRKAAKPAVEADFDVLI